MSPSTLKAMRPRSQRGVTLLELLIGLTIGLLVSVAAVGSLMYTRVSSTTVGDSSRLVQDAAAAFRIIGHQVRQSGARRLLGSAGATVEFNSYYTGFGTTTATTVVTGVDGGTATDRLSISNDGDDGIQVADCLNDIVSMPSASLTAYVSGVTSAFSVSNNALLCDGSGTSIAGAQELIRGVEDFQVWYGERATAADTLQYRTAGNVTDWQQVETVRVCLRLAGEMANNPTVATTGCQNEAVPADGRIRRVFWRVFNLRNVGI